MSDLLEARDPRSLGDFALRGRLRRDSLWQVFDGTAPDGRLATVRLVHSRLARDRAFRRAFRKAIRAVRSVDHPSVLQVTGHRVRANGTWLATERPAGQSLADMASGQGVPTLQLASLAAGLAGALRAIHGAGLVHGDLNPANVYLQGGCQVDGFGFAHLRPGEASLHPRAASFLRGAAAGPDPADDVFSLGVILALRGPWAGAAGHGESTRRPPGPSPLHRSAP